MLVAGFLFLLAFAYFAWVRLQSLLVYFQQDEYDDARFVASLWRIRLFDIRATAAIAVTWLFALTTGWTTAAILGAAGALIGVALHERQYGFKKPLAKTQRAKRIWRLAGALMVAPALIMIWWPVTVFLALQAFPFALVVANRLLQPLQDKVNNRFIDEASAKLARMDPVRIGITGSFGKTTVKHILADVLSASGPVFYSRGSINTKLGLTRHIRQRLQWGHRYFIAEMGAYGIGSISRLCDFVHPSYGIVTAVGHAHTERFGSIDTIAVAKSELAERVCRVGGTVVIPMALLEHEPFEALAKQYGSKLVTVGPPGSQVEIAQATLSGDMWQITLRGEYFPKGKLTYHLPLLGEHNILNSALALTLAVIIDPARARELATSAGEVEQIPHRLQKRDLPGQPLILDDAYNSNQLGFINALHVLRDLAGERSGRAILVTPGIAELGDKHDRVHSDLGTKAAEFCDIVIAVNPGRIPTFIEAAKRANAEITEVADLTSARRILSSIAQPEDVILYENDLPDLLEAKRLL